MFATEASIYPTLVKLDFISTLGYLLSHDNVVISADVVQLLYHFTHLLIRDDLTDEKTIYEDTTGRALELVDTIVLFVASSE